jgi:transposase-like protein
VDSSAAVKMEKPKRQRRSIAEKREIVELAMQPGASVARVAREHGVNANMVHYWRSLYRHGRLGENRTDSVRLLPVSVSESAAAVVVKSATKLFSTPSPSLRCSPDAYEHPINRQCPESRIANVSDIHQINLIWHLFLCVIQRLDLSDTERAIVDAGIVNKAVKVI